MKLVWIIFIVIISLIFALKIFNKGIKYYILPHVYTPYKLINDTYKLNDEMDNDMKMTNNTRWQYMFNPSIIKLGNDMLIVSRVVTKLAYLLWYSNTIIISKITDCDINNPNIIISKPFDIYTTNKNDNETIKGLEDPRIFSLEGDIFILCSKPTNFGKNILYLCKLSSDLLSYDKVIKIIPEKCLGENHKNWNPFIITKQEQLFVSHIQPHNIVKINFDTGEATLLYTSQSLKLNNIYSGKLKLRGGSRYIYTSYGYLSICHYFETFFSRRKYYHIFYLTEKNPPYRIISFSEPFCIPNPVYKNIIQFVSG